VTACLAQSQDRIRFSGRNYIWGGFPIIVRSRGVKCLPYKRLWRCVLGCQRDGESVNRDTIQISLYRVAGEGIERGTRGILYHLVHYLQVFPIGNFGGISYSGGGKHRQHFCFLERNDEGLRTAGTLHRGKVQKRDATVGRPVEPAIVVTDSDCRATLQRDRFVRDGIRLILDGTENFGILFIGRNGR